MATPSHLRQLNQRKVILALMRLGQASRAELAKATLMSQPTVGKIVDDLLSEHILDAVPPGELPDGSANPAPRLGRPGHMVRLDASRPRFLTIQLGVLNTRVSLVPIAVRGSDAWDLEFPTPASPQNWARLLKRSLERLAPSRLDAVLISVPGVVDEVRGDVLLCPNLRWAEQVNFFELLEGLSEAPILLVQEVRAMALGQLAVEPAGGDFLMVDFGDGVGGAAVVGGRLFTSSVPLSGELGHTPVLGNKRPCGCGAVGCVETLVSRRGLLATFAAERRQKDPAWSAMVQHVQERGLEPWLAAAVDAVAVTIAGALNVLGLHRVVVCGSLTEFPPSVIEYLAEALRRGAMWGRFGEVICTGVPRRRTAGLVSAAIDRLLCPGFEEHHVARRLPEPAVR